MKTVNSPPPWQHISEKLLTQDKNTSDSDIYTQLRLRRCYGVRALS